MGFVPLYTPGVLLGSSAVFSDQCMFALSIKKKKKCVMNATNSTTLSSIEQEDREMDEKEILTNNYQRIRP